MRLLLKQTDRHGASLPHLEKADLMRERGLDFAREVFGEHHVTAGTDRSLAEHVLLMRRKTSVRYVMWCQKKKQESLERES